ncbi:MAG: nucleotide exchange factor GrpE, partial [Polyangiales bacterium]
MSENEGDKSGNGQAGDGADDEEVIFPEEEARDPSEAEPSDLEKARAERDRMREQLLRIAADFDNFRKRSRKEIE